MVVAGALLEPAERAHRDLLDLVGRWDGTLGSIVLDDARLLAPTPGALAAAATLLVAPILMVFRD